MCVENEPNATERLLEQLPDVLGRAAKLLADRGIPIVSKLMNREAPAPAPEAAPAPSLLASSTARAESGSPDGDA